MLEAVGERGKYKQKGTHTVVVGLPSQEALSTTELVDKLSALRCCLLLFPYKSQYSLSRLERCCGESVLVQSPVTSLLMFLVGLWGRGFLFSPPGCRLRRDLIGGGGSVIDSPGVS